MALLGTVAGSAVLLTGLLFHPPTPGNSPLARAAVAGDVAAVRAQLERGADANAMADHGCTVLDWAARFGQVEAMRVLVDAGAQMDVQDQGPNGWTALMHACHKGQTKAALALLEWGANPNQASADGTTPLMRAACEHQAEVVRALLDRGADPRATNKNGANVLSSCLNGGTSEIAMMVREQAPDLGLPHDFSTILGLTMARLRGDREMVAAVTTSQR